MLGGDGDLTNPTTASGTAINVDSTTTGGAVNQNQQQSRSQSSKTSLQDTPPQGRLSEISQHSQNSRTLSDKPASSSTENKISTPCSCDACSKCQFGRIAARMWDTSWDANFDAIYNKCNNITKSGKSGKTKGGPPCIFGTTRSDLPLCLMHEGPMSRDSWIFGRFYFGNEYRHKTAEEKNTGLIHYM